MNQCKKSRREQSHALNEERHCLVIERAGDLIPFYLPQKMKSHVTIPMVFFPTMCLHTNCMALKKVKIPGLCEHMAESISRGIGTV